MCRSWVVVQRLAAAAETEEAQEERALLRKVGKRDNNNIHIKWGKK